MISKPLITFAGLLAAVSAITITEPQQGAKLDFSGSNTISWTSVDTDPVSFEIVLVSPNNSTIAQSVITNSVNTTENKYTFSNFVTPVGDNYQVNFLGNVGTNRGIISQSQTFAVTKSGVESTGTSSTGASATATGASQSASASGTSAANALSVTFGIAAPIVAALGMLL
ncbi:extracellular conserved serine-rich protein [Diaporthe amygdali]|uniref:extracellular conserved serine-rich protein n=1 Tax=Phomopsis amygdali TaxID=1214568 RepID=UPI0022FED527|nr:extracellular conserved serine-rich protein [Diaporthe amygdali]KAJ0107786.1 extracellular conserved serine-rich protein [Diaporthe amygdali]